MDAVSEIILRALVVNDGNENFPVWEVYKPEGVALVIRQALAKAGIVAADFRSH